MTRVRQRNPSERLFTCKWLMDGGHNIEEFLISATSATAALQKAREMAKHESDYPDVPGHWEIEEDFL